MAVTARQVESSAAVAARHNLVALLQLAHSGELAATLAYTGHAASVSDPVERAEILAIKEQEIDHRKRVRAMLDDLGVAPEPKRERKLYRIGRTVSAFCHVGGWYAPMYGAAKLERKNVGEYERAAGFAIDAGYPQFVDDLIDMSEVEWDHERYFREKAASHWLWRFSPKWTPPPPRESIRPGVLRRLDGPATSAP